MPSSRRRVRRACGVTLIEVLAGLALLGTLLASMSVARGRFLRQLARAEQQQRATRLADRLVGDWLAGAPESVPVPRSGRASDAPDLMWKTQWLSDPAAKSMGVRVVRLEVVSSSAPNARSGDEIGALATVDFLLYVPPPPPPSTVPARGEVRR